MNRLLPMPIQSVHEMDLDSHMIIEASAGTGKTYTIEEIVLQLLKTERVKSLNQILIVTFTEKATSELRARIREKLKTTAKNEPSRLVKEAIDTFDSASIYTIHGFCNRVLRSYSFENQSPSKRELCSDTQIYRHVLNNLLLRQWPDTYETAYEDLIRITFADISSKHDKDSLLDTIQQLALAVTPEAGDRTVPDPTDDLKDLHRAISINSEQILKKIDALLCRKKNENPEITSGLQEKFQALNINGQKKKIFSAHIICPLEELLKSYRLQGFSLIETCNFLKKSLYKIRSFKELNENWNKQGPDFNEHFPEFPFLIELLEKLLETNPLGLKDLFIARAIADTYKAALEYKKLHGLVSYSDMLTEMYLNLTKTGSMLKEVLKKAYRYALVDEFQDTDMLQWHIFKTLFLNSSENRLIVVGDPKQAIYGFRGADVHAYYEAKKEIITSHKGKYYSLTSNWRSLPKLLTAFNCLFGSSNWFQDEQVQYFENKSPEGLFKVRKHLNSWDTTEPPVISVNMGTCSNSEARKRMAEFCADEIQDLLSKNSNLKPKEIAILVCNRNETIALEQSLEIRGIPFSLYKKEGLYQSEAALHVKILFQALASPENSSEWKAAMLTFFFQVPLQDLASDDYIDHHEQTWKKLQAWQNLAFSRKWSVLFQSIYRDSLLLKNSIQNESSFTADIQLILNELSKMAYAKNSSIIDIAGFCARRYSAVQHGQDTENFHAMDDDPDHVKLMTIHASKGLEFSYVFLAGGFTKTKPQKFQRFHSDNTRYFTVRNMEQYSEIAEKEMLQESHRLFYVALTRSACRIYLPVYTPASHQASRASGYINKYLKNALKSLEAEQGLLKSIQSIGDFEPDVKHNFLKSKIKENFVSASLLIQEAISFRSRTVPVYSYSSIHQQKSRTLKQLFDSAIRVQQNLHEDETYHDLSYSEKSTDSLAPGRITGNMLHSILEKIAFSKLVQNKGENHDLSIKMLIQESILAHYPGLDSDEQGEWNRIIYQIIQRALCNPLPGINIPICDTEKNWREMEFYLSFHSKGVTECTHEFLHGFIDLIFKHDGKYYIVDWKSNSLPDYSPESLAAHIKESDYDLQYHLYLCALDQWLAKTTRDYKFSEHVGGVYYIYLRGLEDNKNQYGIFYDKPSIKSMKNFFNQHLPEMQIPGPQNL